jgi:DNA-binding response OmpR family regulator
LNWNLSLVFGVPVQSKTQESVMSEPLKVLIVDDDSSIQQIVEEILCDGGFKPQSASTGEEAISLLKATRYCSVIIDISFGMDHVRGWARCEAG